MASSKASDSIRGPFDYAPNKTDVSFTQNWINSTQRRMGPTQPSTTTALESILSVSRYFSANVRAGAEFTYRHQNQEADSALPGFTKPGRLGREKLQLDLFAQYQIDGFSITPSLYVGPDYYELERPDVLTGLTGMATSAGWHGGVNLEISYLMPVTEWLFVRPIADIDYQYLTVNPFTETGAGPNNVAFDRVHDERTVAQIGAGIGGVVPLGEAHSLIPFLQARYRRNFNSDPITTSARLASGLANLGDLALSTSQEGDGLILNTGFFYAGRSNIELRAAYEGEYFQHSTTHTLSGRLKFTF